jgi:predicted PurR-regulated permease PerM
MAEANQVARSSLVLKAASVVVVIAALYLAKGVLIPLTLAVLMSFFLSPLCTRMERMRLGRIPAVMVTAILGFSILGVGIWMTVVQVTQLAPKIPEYQHNIEVKLSSINKYFVKALNQINRTTQDESQDLSLTETPIEPLGTAASPYAVRILSSPTSPLQVFGGMYGTLVETLGTIGIVIVLVIFFLIRREDLRDRFIRLVGKGNVTLITQVLEDASARISRYLSTLLIVNLAFGICVGVGLHFIGVPNAILWGTLAATLRFVPYIGPWIAAAMPISLAMASSTSWLAPMLTVGLFISLEVFNNNILEPWLYGKNTGVSPVAILLAAIFWMWLWGTAGLLLATPLTVCVLVIGQHVPQLSFFDILLGTEPVFEPHVRIYQRLLAGDQDEATIMFERFLEQQSDVEVYDTVIIPALAMAETHWQLGDLNESRHNFIIQSLRDMIQVRFERLQEIGSKKNTVPEVAGAGTRLDQSKPIVLSIICLPSRTEADEITSAMLSQILGSDGSHMKTDSVVSMAAGEFEAGDGLTADVVFLSATPPAAVMHARHLCKRLRSKLPDVKIFVGLWHAQGDLIKFQELIGCGSTVVATLADAQTQIQQYATSRTQAAK